MKLRLNELESGLKRRLAPVYLVAGDEPLQAMQAADAVRQAARDQGYDERLVLDAEAGFDWNELRGAADNFSLFAQRRVLDLRMPAAKPGAAGSETLVNYAEHPPPDALLLVQTGKLDRNAVNSAWMKALDRAGVIVQVWPLDARQTRQWIAARLQEKGFKASDDAISLLASRGQGNLLAASQEIEKLSLLRDPASPDTQVLEREHILASVADSARFNVFELADAVLAGQRAQAVRILRGLAAEDTPAALVLWSLSEQARLLATASDEVARGRPADRAIESAKQHRRAALVKHALKRAAAADWQRSLGRCARADRVVKGQTPGDPWDELLNLTLSLCGMPLFTATGEEM